MSEAADRVARAEHRTKSELIREALRWYLTQRPASAAVGAGMRLARVGELAELYRRKSPACPLNESELRQSFRGIRRMHQRLKDQLV